MTAFVPVQYSLTSAGEGVFTRLLFLSHLLAHLTVLLVETVMLPSQTAPPLSIY